MRIRTITTDYMGSHCYIVIENMHAIIIDPGDADLVKQAILEESVIIDFIIITHEHCDHIVGCTKIREEFHSKVIASSICNDNMQDSRKNFSRYYNAFIELQTKYSSKTQKKIAPFTTFADEVFDGELIINWMGHRLYLKETPGHSLGSICVVVDDNLLFSGDTLLEDDSVGTEFLGGSRKKFREDTLPWLSRLSDRMLVYAGHGNVFMLGDRLSD